MTRLAPRQDCPDELELVLDFEESSLGEEDPLLFDWESSADCLSAFPSFVLLPASSPLASLESFPLSITLRLLADLKSVSYQPLPLSRNPAAEISFRTPA